MADTTVESLVYVIDTGAREVRLLGQRLEKAAPTEVEPILRAIQNEADSLSSGLARLSQYVDSMPDESSAKTPQAPDPDRSAAMLAFIRRRTDAFQNGFCEVCGKVRREEPLGGVVTLNRAIEDDGKSWPEVLARQVRDSDRVRAERAKAGKK